MKTFQVSYYLSDMYHCYCIEAENEAQAIQRVLNGMCEAVKEIMHDFKIKRHSSEWN